MESNILQSATLPQITTAVTAVGALGTAAFGLLDASKLLPGLIPSSGFTFIRELVKQPAPSGNLIGGLIDRGNPNVTAALGRLSPSAPWPGKILPNPRLPSFWKYGHTDYMTTKSVDGDFAQPVNVPDPSILSYPAGMSSGEIWKPCWSAGYAATRWLLP